jgi:hypothetical protein
MKEDVGTLFFNLNEWDARPFPPSYQETEFLDKKIKGVGTVVSILAKGDGQLESGIRRTCTELSDQWAVFGKTILERAKGGNPNWWRRNA